MVILPIFRITPATAILPRKTPNSSDLSADFFKAKVTTLFAIFPIRVTSGRLVWLKTVYTVTQIRDGDKGWYTFQASYSPEEYVIAKLTGE